MYNYTSDPLLRDRIRHRMCLSEELKRQKVPRLNSGIYGWMKQAKLPPYGMNWEAGNQEKEKSYFCTLSPSGGLT